MLATATVRSTAPAFAPPTWGRAALAIAGGLLIFLAFPPLGLWFCAPLGVAPVIASVYGVRPRRALWIGYLAGLAFMLPAMAWVRPIGEDAWLALVAIESVFWAVQALLVSLVIRMRLWPLWAACLWVLQERGRSTFPVGGFPWARLAFSQGTAPYLKYASLGGAPLVTFTVALTGCLLAYLAVHLFTRDYRERVVALTAAGVVALPVVGMLVPLHGDEGKTVNIGVIQGSVPRNGGLGLSEAEPAVVLKNHAAETHRLAEAVRAGKYPKPDLVVWPENSTDIDPYRSPEAYAIIDAAVKDVGVPVLVGAVVAIGDDSRATRSVVWDPVTGPGDHYDKQKLVPFGEFTPYKDLVLSLFERANLVGRQSIPGDEPGDLKVGPVTVGAVSCYEVAFDTVVNGTVRAGGSPLVVQTNNATYELSNLPPQQLAMSRIRAVEHNRAVIPVATTGISAHVAPDGSILWETPELVAAMNVVTAQVRTSDTLATRVGVWPEIILMMAGTGAAVVAVASGVAARRSRRD
ncbi:apolipoprotein N-acyltransferase [Herbidospora mongoliensis]|uniref:apolipoprotein N-acyltransferase n=1 Tax=Herbidospora mongoliensis TaxID=688067 RepID=UPI000AF17A0E|nr:apolipoprotein N-acyltransferase [Herbidospora mongoliensis]